jgi:hypothetical protein
LNQLEIHIHATITYFSLYHLQTNFQNEDKDLEWM